MNFLVLFPLPTHVHSPTHPPAHHRSSFFFQYITLTQASCATFMHVLVWLHLFRLCTHKPSHTDVNTQSHTCGHSRTSKHQDSRHEGTPPHSDGPQTGSVSSVPSSPDAGQPLPQHPRLAGSVLAPRQLSVRPNSWPTGRRRFDFLLASGCSFICFI